MSARDVGTRPRDVQYLVLPDASNPLLLARVRWPDVFQAISAAQPDWRSDPGLFDLPYDPSSRVVTHENAEAIAAEWGARLPAPDEGAVAGPSLIRRMPANWSALSPAAKRAWSIEPRVAPGPEPAGESWWARRRRRRAEAGVTVDPDAVIVLRDVEPADGIDLTDEQVADTVAIAEEA